MLQWSSNGYADEIRQWMTSLRITCSPTSRLRILNRFWPMLLLLLHSTAAAAATLVGFAVLPADTFRPGPTSGQFIEPVNGRTPPFLQQQPVQGFSALLDTGSNRYLVLSDNGFGKRANSSDYLLCMYIVEPGFRTATGGKAVIKINEVIPLSDPSRFIPYEIVRKTDRLLTGADLDPESFQRAADGSFWIGEEFNPSLTHFNDRGELLAPPFTLAGLSSVDNPSGALATLPVSRGFEGMGISPDGKYLYPMLEGALLNGEGGLNIYTFDIASEQFLNSSANDPSYRYRLDENATAIGDFTLYSASAGLVVERDSNQGTSASVKKVYQVDFEQVGTDGYLVKTLVADLLDINDPNDLNGDGQDKFTFPFWTIEGLVVVNRSTLAIVNDNNYPLGPGREKKGAEPDNTELILLEISPLWE